MARKSKRSEKQWTNAAVADVLEELGELLELQGENPFKVRAYHNAARTLRSEERDVGELVRSGALADLKGFGEAMTEKVTALVETGEIPALAKLHKAIPEGMLEILRIPGMGPKKAKAVWEDLGVTTVGELEYACKENRLLDLAGFGEKSQRKVLDGIAFLRRNQGLFLVSEALAAANAALARLRERKEVARAEIAGSLRRRKEIVHDADIVAASAKPAAVVGAFVKMPGVERVLAEGETKASVVLEGGLQVDLRVVSEEEYPFALYYFTGSKEHNVALRARAKRYGWKLNEYGLFTASGKRAARCKDEAALLKALELDFIPPELREDAGELLAAERGALPDLVEPGDIRGVLHNHSDYSDGAATLREMALAAKKLGHEYFGISDHSRSAAYAHGLDLERIRAQHKEIDALNEEFSGFRVLKGIECDILGDGRMDYPDSILATFDFVVASVHSQMKQDRETMTRRVIRAVENPHVSILGHPTGRLLLAREPFALDLDAVMKAAAKRGVAVEINANPHRLDADWRVLRRGREMGARFCVNPDAHAVSGLADTDYGVGVARKGWLEKGDVLNALPLKELLKELRA